jgi:hypothetical protein
MLDQNLLQQLQEQTRALIYRVYKKKLNRFEIALNFAKQSLVSSFFMYIASLGTYKV